MRISRFSFKLSIIFVCLLLGILGHSKETALKKKPKKQKKASVLSEKSLIDRNKKISQEVDSIASSIDTFLSGDEIGESEKNNTSFVISNRFKHEEGGDFEYEPSFQLHLRLPNLEKKWKLKLSSFDEEDRKNGVSGRRVESDANDEQLGTSLELVESVGKIRTSFIPRLQLSPKLGMSYLLKFDRKYTWSFVSWQPTLSFFAKPEKGTGLFTSYNTTFQFSEKSYLSMIHEWEYSDLDNRLQANNGWNHTYLYSGRKSFIQSVIWESTNRPTYHLDKIVLSTGYYHKWFYRVFHYEVIPYLQFSKEFNFKGKAGIRFHANFIF